jgi:hypothetical protein
VGSGLAGKNDKDEGGDEVMTDVDLSTTITVRTIEEIAGVVPDAVVNRLIDAMQPRKGKSTYQGVFNAVTDIVADGWSATQLLSQVRLQGAYLFLFGHYALLEDVSTCRVQRVYPGHPEKPNCPGLFGIRQASC